MCIRDSPLYGRISCNSFLKGLAEPWYASMENAAAKSAKFNKYSNLSNPKMACANITVSYTHLDVYKRQVTDKEGNTQTKNLIKE